MTSTATLDLDAQLVPDSTTWAWGPGYGDRSYPDETLDEFARYISETVQPGYGPRLLVSSPGYVPGGDVDRAVVPVGFDATGHPNRAGVDPSAMDPEFATAIASPVQLVDGLQDYCRSRGWVLDQHRRPLHPHHGQLLADPRIGLPTGLGYAYWFGETAVVDVVATVSSGRVLLTTRTTDVGEIPSLPGGYSRPQDFGRTSARWRAGDRPLTVDGLIAAGRRKLREETGVEIPADAQVRIVRAIRPVSSPHTLHAWTATYTLHVALPASPAPLNPGSSASWHDVDDLVIDVMPTMWPDHQRALQAAIV